MPARSKRTKSNKARRAKPARRPARRAKATKKPGRKSAAKARRGAAKAKKKPRKAPQRPPRKGKAPARRPARKPAKPARKPARKPAKPTKVSRERERAQRARERERAQRERERAQRERERERARREREREQLTRAREREKLRAQKEREKLAKQREHERIRAQKEREREKARAQKERERLAKQRAAEREREKKAREKERARIAAERAAEKKAREEQREREREEARRIKEEERAAREAERERQREEARRIKEEERAKREAEREAYRKAKEAERERLRAEREAARRALEGKVARATKRAQRVAGVGRGITTRVYRPDLIPNQSGTTRRVPEALAHKFLGVRVPEPVVPSAPAQPTPGEEAPPVEGAAAPGEEAAAAAPPREPPPEKLDERYAQILERLKDTDDEFRREYGESFDMSWIYHDSALEGVVYTFQELKTAIDPNITVVPDSSLQPVCEEIRRHKAAIDMVRELADKKRVPINVDIIKKIYLTLHPEEGDLKSVKYRKDIPQHRLYFHEYAPPDKIAYRVRQVLDWLNGPEPKKIKNALRVAARVHYDLLRIFPFPQDSGKVSRLLMNLILLRNGFPPAIVHSTERQRYYEALKGSLPTIVNMVQEAIINALASIEKKLDERETRLRAFST